MSVNNDKLFLALSNVGLVGLILLCAVFLLNGAANLIDYYKRQMPDTDKPAATAGKSVGAVADAQGIVKELNRK